MNKKRKKKLCVMFYVYLFCSYRTIKKKLFFLCYVMHKKKITKKKTLHKNEVYFSFTENVKKKNQSYFVYDEDMI